jgi:hypothetical protein
MSSRQESLDLFPSAAQEKDSQSSLVAAHHLAVDQAGANLEVVHGLDHQRVALRPVVAPAGNQANAHRIAAGHKPETAALIS